MLLPLLGLLVGVLAGLVLNVNVSYEFSRYSAVAILAALDSVLGAVRAELDGVYDNRIFISGFLVNAIIAVLLTFIGDRLGLDLYLVALITFGLRIFNNVALIDATSCKTDHGTGEKRHGGTRSGPRRHRRRHQQGLRAHRRGEPRRPATTMGHGTVASGLKKGVVINIDQTVRSIADVVERAERCTAGRSTGRSSGWAASTSRT